MEIDKIASAIGSNQNIPGVTQSSGSQNSQIEELQRLADTIRKMESDFRITARVQGMSGSGFQTKLHQYDDLLSKVDQQIRQLEHQDNHQENTKDGDPKRLGVTMLQYNTEATDVVLQNSGRPYRAALSDSTQAQISKAQANAAERKTEQKLATEAQQKQDSTDVPKTNSSVDILV